MHGLASMEMFSFSRHAVSAYDTPLQLAFTTQPQGGFYRLGSVVSLSCATAVSNLTILWVHNDSVVVPDASRSTNGESLTILSLSPALSGSYRCLATGGDGGTLTSAIALVRVAGERPNKNEMHVRIIYIYIREMWNIIYLFPPLYSTPVQPVLFEP